MKLTTKGRYAVMAMLDILLNGTDSPVNLADISKRQQISLSYLEQLFAKLRLAKLVYSIRGPGGGYKLKRDPHALSIAEIIDAVNDQRGNDYAEDGDPAYASVTHYLWEGLSEEIHGFLSGISLASVAERASGMQQRVELDQRDLILSNDAMRRASNLI